MLISLIAKITCFFRQKPKTYSIVYDNVTWKFIDTPGLSDTRGIEQDDANMESIIAAIKKAGGVHGIIFVMPSNISKLTSSLETMFVSVISALPRHAQNQTYVCFTNSRGTFYKLGDSLQTLGAISQILSDYKIVFNFAKENLFCFDNEAFRYLCAAKANFSNFYNLPQEDVSFYFLACLLEIKKN